MFLLVLISSAAALRCRQRKPTAHIAYLTGLKAYRDRQWPQAAKNFRHYLAANPDDVPTLLKYARSQLNIRPVTRANIQQAAAACKNILRIEKNNSHAAKTLISLYLQINIPAQAQSIAEQYLKTNKDPKISTMLAMALAKQQAYEQATQLLKQIIKDNPEEIIAPEVLKQMTAHIRKHPPPIAE